MADLEGKKIFTEGNEENEDPIWSLNIKKSFLTFVSFCLFSSPRRDHRSRLQQLARS
jgi:hypothetical protein